MTLQTNDLSICMNPFVLEFVLAEIYVALGYKNKRRFEARALYCSATLTTNWELRNPIVGFLWGHLITKLENY